MYTIALLGFGIMIGAALLSLWAAVVISKREEQRAEAEYQKFLASMHKDRSKAG